MIKKKFLAVILVAVALFLVYLLWPRSLERYIADCETVRIYCVEDGVIKSEMFLDRMCEDVYNTEDLRISRKSSVFFDV